MIFKEIFASKESEVFEFLLENRDNELNIQNITDLFFESEKEGIKNYLDKLTNLNILINKDDKVKVNIKLDIVKSLIYILEKSKAEERKC